MSEKLNAEMARRVRARRGDMSFREAGQSAGVPHCTIHRVESKRPSSIETFAKLARWCEIDVNKLFAETVD